jgi:hypothetical protein
MSLLIRNPHCDKMPDLNLIETYAVDHSLLKYTDEYDTGTTQQSLTSACELLDQKQLGRGMCCLPE